MDLRKARVPDVPGIQKLVNSFADKGEMLPRSLNAVYENIRDFFVIEEDGEIVGSCAMHVAWGDLAEVKSLAVSDKHQKKGYGKLLVDACINEAREMGLPRVFALTYRPDFFKKLGFSDLDKSELPHKIWSECINCPKFPDCGEEAVALDL